MKKIFYIIVGALITLQSCIVEAPVGRDGQDGRSFFKINYDGGEPYFVDAGGVVPDRFVWDTYYTTSPGNYLIYYEYEHFYGFTRVIDPFELEVQVYYYEGEPADYNYDGKDGNDVYFELVITPNGYDFYDVVDYKSEKIENNVTERTQIGTKEIIKNNKRVVYTLYKLPQKVGEK